MARQAQPDKIGSGKAAKEGHGEQLGGALVTTSRTSKKPQLEHWRDQPPILG